MPWMDCESTVYCLQRDATACDVPLQCCRGHLHPEKPPGSDFILLSLRRLGEDVIFFRAVQKCEVVFPVSFFFSFFLAEARCGSPGGSELLAAQLELITIRRAWSDPQSTRHQVVSAIQPQFLIKFPAH